MGKHVQAVIDEDLVAALEQDAAWRGNQSQVIRESLQLWVELDNPTELLADGSQHDQTTDELPAD